MFGGMLRSRCIAFSEILLKSNFDVLRQSHKTTVPNICASFKSKYSTAQNNTKYDIASHNEENVYDGTLSKQIRAVKVFSLSSSILGIIAQPIIYSKSLEVGGAPVMVAVCGVVGFFTFVTPVLLHLLTRKYVTKIVYNKGENTYTATLLTFILIRKKITFTVEDVDVPDVPGMFTTFIAKKTPMFVDCKEFKDPNHFVKIMGFDKPMDFKLDEFTINESDKSKK